MCCILSYERAQLPIKIWKTQEWGYLFLFHHNFGCCLQKEINPISRTIYFNQKLFVKAKVSMQSYLSAEINTSKIQVNHLLPLRCLHPHQQAITCNSWITWKHRVKVTKLKLPGSWRMLKNLYTPALLINISTVPQASMACTNGNHASE